jgi:SAM-dependent methyltransferase
MNGTLTERIRNYWNEHIHDLSIARHPVGSAEFFDELDAYRFEKLNYLPSLVDFGAYTGKKLLEIGCGAGIDLVRFAGGGALTAGVDLSQTAIDLAKKNFARKKLRGTLQIMDGERLDFPENSFDVVYAHGVIQYTADPARMIAEMHRVLKPGGEAIAMLYNRRSWLNALSKLTKVDLEHEDAPAFRTFTLKEAQRLFGPFRRVRLVPERFPVKSRLQTGWKAALFNHLFVGLFNIIPKPVVRRWGWHIMIFAEK